MPEHRNPVDVLRKYVDDVVVSYAEEAEHDAVEGALVAVEALLQAARRVAGYGDDLKPIWQVGAGQDWGQWRDEKEALREALGLFDTGQGDAR